MKRIIKREPPESLETYKKTRGASFDNMPKDVKDELRNSLVEEQGGLCCYCEKRIWPDHHSVIEHLLPKGNKVYSHLQLEYSNLLCSCDGGEAERKGKTKKEKRAYPPCCDDKKNDDLIAITPLNEDCEDYFIYDDEGHIYGKSDAAQETVDILGLDCSTLVSKRKAAIDAYSDLRLTEAEWSSIVDGLYQRDQDGLFLPFCIAVIFYIQHYKMSLVGVAS